MKLSLRATALTLLALTAAAAQAHNPWLLPSTTVLSKAGIVSIDAAASTHLFLADHQPLQLEGLRITAPDGSAPKAENETKLRHRAVFDLNITQPGTWRVAQLTSGLFANWKDKATGQPKRARGSADMLAKEIPADAQELVILQSMGRVETFITMGKPSAINPVGVGLELAATGNLTDLVKGEKSSFTLLLDGQPAKNLEVTVTAGNTQYRDKLEEIKLKTDDKGQFSVTWPAAGMYWLDASTKDNKTTVPQAKERRLNYAATLEVMP